MIDVDPRLMVNAGDINPYIDMRRVGVRVVRAGRCRYESHDDQPELDPPRYIHVSLLSCCWLKFKTGELSDSHRPLKFTLFKTRTKELPALVKSKSSACWYR